MEQGLQPQTPGVEAFVRVLDILRRAKTQLRLVNLEGQCKDPLKFSRRRTQ
jgi:hypothetical protein